MKPLALVLATALAAAGLVSGTAMAQTATPGPVIAPASTLLTIAAEGKTSRQPDLALFNAGVTTQGATASAAMTANSADMNRVMAALRKAGIAERDVQTSSIALNPVYGQPVTGPNGAVVQEPRIVGYQATNSVTVRQRDLTAFGKVIDALVSAGANNVNGPQFLIDDADAATDEARAAAIAKAQARAAIYARAAGLRVVRIVSISEAGGFAPPMPVMYAKADMGGMASSTPVAAGEVEATVAVTVQFELAR